MKRILISDNTLSYLSPGGKLTHAKVLKENLQKIGYLVDYENWYDRFEKPDVVICLGFDSVEKISKYRRANIKTVLILILDQISNSSTFDIFLRKAQSKIIDFLPWSIRSRFLQSAYKLFDKIVFINAADLKCALSIYGIPKEKTIEIPHGVDKIDIRKNYEIKDYYLSIGNITPRKNQIELIQMFKSTTLKLKIIGGLDSQNDEYTKRFLDEVKGSPNVEYLGFVSGDEKRLLLRSARGFVSLSKAESGCIAAYEAASFGVPLLLPDLPWARSYSDCRSVFILPNSKKRRLLFLDEIDKNIKEQESTSFFVKTWEEIAKEYGKVIDELLLEK